MAKIVGVRFKNAGKAVLFLIRASFGPIPVILSSSIPYAGRLSDR